MTSSYSGTHENVTNLPINRAMTTEMRHEMIMKCSKDKNVILALPSLYEEFEKPAMDQILKEISEINYIDYVVIGLDQADQAQYEEVVERVKVLPQKVCVLWNDGPERLKLQEHLLSLDGIDPPVKNGKGKNVWGIYGFVISLMKEKAMSADDTIIVMHDCDIVTYDRGIVDKLCMPMLLEDKYDFVKGDYFRHNGQYLGGRATRMFVKPFIRAVEEVFGTNGTELAGKVRDYTRFIGSFGYPLSGEMSIRGSELAELEQASDWAMEVGLLSYFYKRRTKCVNADVCDQYDHKHQILSASNNSQLDGQNTLELSAQFDLEANQENSEEAGIIKMILEIAKRIIRNLNAMGVSITLADIKALGANYAEQAEKEMSDDQTKALNFGLKYNPAAEKVIVKLAQRVILKAFKICNNNIIDPTMCPSWSDVEFADSEIFKVIYEGVQKDRASIMPQQAPVANCNNDQKLSAPKELSCG